MYSRSTGRPSARRVRRSTISSGAPGGAPSTAAVCGSALTASTVRLAPPRGCPAWASIRAKMSGGPGPRPSRGAPISAGEVGEVEGERQAVQPAEAFDVDHAGRGGGAGGPEPGGDGGGRDDQSRGADLVDDLAVLAQGLGQAEQPVQAVRVLPPGDHGADARHPDHQPFGRQHARARPGSRCARRRSPGPGSPRPAAGRPGRRPAAPGGGECRPPAGPSRPGGGASQRERPVLARRGLGTT